jgi:hypothetical protein
MSLAISTRRPSRTAALLLPSAGFWLLLAAMATAGGIARELVLVPLVGELRGHQIGTLLVTFAFVVAITMFVTRMRLSPNEGLVIGVAWLVCAIVFEFGFGHYVDGLSWNLLLSDYDVSQGRLLLLVWVAVGAGPFVAAYENQRQRRS